MNTEQYTVALEVAHIAERMYNAGEMSSNLDRKDVKYMFRYVKRVCKIIETETRNEEKKAWESINLLPELGKMIGTFFKLSPFCVDEKNYNRFRSLRGSIDSLLGERSLNAKSRAFVNEVTMLCGHIYRIRKEVSENEQKLTDCIPELNVRLYEEYRNRIIMSNNSIFSVVIEFLGMSFFTDKEDEYNELIKRHDYLVLY